MRHPFKMKAIFLFSFLPFLLFSCKDKQGLLSPYYFKCGINGVSYIDRQSGILPPGATKSPNVYYFLSDKLDKYVAFSSNVTLESAPSTPQKYSIIFRIPIDEPIIIGKKYEVKAIDGEDYLQPMSQLLKYNEQKIPYGTISAIDNDAAGWCFGIGHVEFSTIDLQKGEAKGTLEFNIPSPVKSDKGKILTIQGEFFSKIKTD